MSQLNLFLFFLIFIVIFIFSKYQANYEGFLSSELVETPLSEENTLIFTPGFLNSDHRRQPLVNSPGKFGHLWDPSQELKHFRYPQFNPGKLHSVTFGDRMTQIAGPIHKPPCPPVGTVSGFTKPTVSEYEKVLTGHQLGERHDELVKEARSLCVCEDP
jgi:hypothetical protein